MMSNYEIRKKSREQLGNNIFCKKWGMALLASVIASTIINAISSMGAAFLAGWFIIGYAAVFMGISRGKEEIDLADLFIGFKGERLGKSLLLYILVVVFTFLWSLLLIIPGIIKAYSYSMAFFVMNDHPEYTAKQCIDESRRLMDGHKFDLFCLELSFLGWIILSAFTFGVGMLWVTPYMQTAQANFYEELIKEKGRSF